MDKTIKKSLGGVLLPGLLALISTGATAHHSFAVHFVADRQVTVEGVVTDFRFTNPHGKVYFTALDDQGNEVVWEAETNSPNLLKRRGWDRDVLKPGDAISIVGWPSRDGRQYLRISRVTFADGREITGQAASPEDALNQD